MYLDKIITIIRDDNESDRLQMQVGLELLQTDLHLDLEQVGLEKCIYPCPDRF